MIPNNILLLKIIENNGKISLLRDRGLTHSQIAMMIKNLEAEGNILITDDDILYITQEKAADKATADDIKAKLEAEGAKVTLK